jgi:hypothetical protein
MQAAGFVFVLLHTLQPLRSARLLLVTATAAASQMDSSPTDHHLISPSSASSASSSCPLTLSTACNTALAVTRLDKREMQIAFLRQRTVT